MRLRQSRTFRREQCSLKPVYEGAGPHTPVSEGLPVVGSGNETLSQSLQCNQVVALSTPIAEIGDIGHDRGQESVHLSLLAKAAGSCSVLLRMGSEESALGWVRHSAEE